MYTSFAFLKNKRNTIYKKTVKAVLVLKSVDVVFYYRVFAPDGGEKQEYRWQYTFLLMSPDRVEAGIRRRQSANKKLAEKGNS